MAANFVVCDALLVLFVFSSFASNVCWASKVHSSSFFEPHLNDLAMLLMWQRMFSESHRQTRWMNWGRTILDGLLDTLRGWVRQLDVGLMTRRRRTGGRGLLKV